MPRAFMVSVGKREIAYGHFLGIAWVVRSYGDNERDVVSKLLPWSYRCRLNIVLSLGDCSRRC